MRIRHKASRNGTHGASLHRMAARTHPAQLLICHELIGLRERDKHDRRRFCDLKARAWCFDCGYYVCSTHRLARHGDHNVETDGR